MGYYIFSAMQIATTLHRTRYRYRATAVSPGSMLTQGAIPLIFRMIAARI
jgi:hypothetical protein